MFLRSVFQDTFAAKLIEECGLKGFRVGNAEVSDKHANFIVNLGNASAKDIESIIDYVELEVMKRKGVKLEREVKILGDFLNWAMILEKLQYLWGVTPMKGLSHF